MEDVGPRRDPASSFEPEVDAVAKVFRRVRGDPLVEAIVLAAAAAPIERRTRSAPRATPARGPR